MVTYTYIQSQNNTNFNIIYNTNEILRKRKRMWWNKLNFQNQKIEREKGG